MNLKQSLSFTLLGMTSLSASAGDFHHSDQRHFIELIQAGSPEKAFSEAFAAGDRTFETEFTAADGVGAHVGDGERFTRAPRADMNGPRDWANHFPARSTGPNAQSCTACHAVPAQDGSGSVVANEARDPFHMGDPRYFISRNTTHLFGAGAIQKLAEEMTYELHQQLDEAKAESCKSGKPVTRKLLAKGTDFGSVSVRVSHRIGSLDAGTPDICKYKIYTGRVQGVDSDLVIRPYQWKGSVAFLRDFNRGAAHNELGMQGVELVGDGKDGDFDGVVDELSVGDITAITVYNAAQPRPTTRIELAQLRQISPLPRDEVDLIHKGEDVFKMIGCTSCHATELKISNPIFTEPSQSPYYRDAVFPGAQDPISKFVDPRQAISFDLTKDQPENQIIDSDGQVIFRLGAFEKDEKGQAVVRLLSDLKRHDLGAEVAEAIDETGTGASVFLTRPLWGVGSTAPYMHDGRATTLSEAVQYHGGEAARSRLSFNKLSKEEQDAVVAYLSNQVLFKKQ